MQNGLVGFSSGMLSLGNGMTINLALPGPVLKVSATFMWKKKKRALQLGWQQETVWILRFWGERFPSTALPGNFGFEFQPFRACTNSRQNCQNENRNGFSGFGKRGGKRGTGRARYYWEWTADCCALFAAVFNPAILRHAIPRIAEIGEKRAPERRRSKFPLQLPPRQSDFASFNCGSGRSSRSGRSGRLLFGFVCFFLLQLRDRVTLVQGWLGILRLSKLRRKSKLGVCKLWVEVWIQVWTQG